MFTGLKLIGAAYIVFLGIRAISHRRSLSTVLNATMVSRGTRRILLEGFIVGVTNPKSIVFFAAILPQFVTTGSGNVPSQMVELGLFFVAISLLSDATWVYVAGSARNWFARSPRRLELVGGAGGLMMIVGVRLALTGRKD